MSNLVMPPKVICEVCHTEEFPAYEHMKCATCGKWVCSKCAKFRSVKIRRGHERKHVVVTRRVCPDCYFAPTK